MDLIVAASGVEDKDWGTYSKATLGILTVRSELGEPIHKVTTCGVKMWKEFADRYALLSSVVVRRNSIRCREFGFHWNYLDLVIIDCIGI